MGNSDISDSDDEINLWDEVLSKADMEMVSLPCSCLFCSFVGESGQACLEHQCSCHDVDLIGLAWKLNLDFYGFVKLINYARMHKPSPREISSLSCDKFSCDTFLHPVMQDDALLQLNIEDLILERSSVAHVQHDKNCVESSVEIRLANAEERACMAEQALERALGDLHACQSHIRANLLEKPASSTDEKKARRNSDSEAYFGSYAHFGIHEEMLKDSVRTEAYRNFILSNAELFKDKVVLDVGCGSGILSMFAAQAGAKHVIAVDQSDVAYQAMDIIRENKLDQTITVVKGRAEDIELPHGLLSVDIIISEWMGYFLLYESMLDTVLECRNHFLRDGGCIYPNFCNVFLVALSDEKLYRSKISFWDNVYGFKMSAMKSSVVEEPLIEVVDEGSMISHQARVQSFDLMKDSSKDLDFDSIFEFSITSDAVLHGVIGYFDVEFDKDASTPVSFSTGPHAKATHWKQVVFFLKDPFAVSVGQRLRGRIFCKKNKLERRALDICLIFFNGEDGEIRIRQHYVIS